MVGFRRHNGDDDSTDEEHDDVDPELRLRTVRTAASATQEGFRIEERNERRKSRRIRKGFFRSKSTLKRPSTASSQEVGKPKEVPGKRRNVYVNYPPSAMEVDQNGEIIVRYVRNKVRTTKYTLVSFIPKNLYEQFRRVANLFFLTLVVLQLIPVFGAATGAISVLPLAFILTVTAIKDGVEDWRRGQIDEEVNTTAVTKFSGGWRNVNQPKDPRSFIEKLLGLNTPGKVTKGVRKLRDREAGQAEFGMRVMLSKAGESRASFATAQEESSSISLDVPRGAGGRRLEDIQSVDSHSYPPPTLAEMSNAALSDMTMVPSNQGSVDWKNPIGSLSQYQASVRSQSHGHLGVIDMAKRMAGIGRWERTLWKKLEVGDIVLLRDNEQVPADIVVLSTSDADGLCYVETKNLDGETNLKPRRSVKATSNITSEEDIERSSFYLDSEPPHQNLYLYHGVLRYKDPSTTEQKQEPVSINELLLRGCAIRNTNWVIGLVVFTGSDTKIMLNGGDTPSKRSKIEKETNFNVLVNFAVLTIMCTVAAIFNGLEDNKQDTSSKFFERGVDPTDSSIVNAIVTFVSCLIAFQNIVPISLYISIEIVKTIQAYFISQDVDMYYQAYDTPCVPKTWNISDDLGQIEYVFSDKTGTLTQNIMEFQKCSIYGTSYGEGITEAQRGAATREGKADTLNPEELNEKLAALKQQMLATMDRAFKNRWLQAGKLTLISPKLAEDLTNRQGEQRQHIIAFFRALALCHSVLSDKPDPQNEPYLLDYKAESPDEAALVAAARDAGFPFVGKTKDGIDIEVMGQPEHYVPLRMLEFNSTRKRMSVIVRAPDGRLILYCKGADSVIYARLSPKQDPEIKENTSKDMEMFANNGLRTLCIAYRYLEEDEYLTWSRTYEEAINSIEGRDEAIDRANEMIEHSLHILGATALEDKLQEGVPEAIDTLHRAGIKLWILTGDKLQTAIEIGYSCNLLKNNMDVMIISAQNLEETRTKIEAGLNKIASILGPPSFKPEDRGFSPNAKASFAVVIDGDTLRHALSDELKELFLNLGTQCETVVCCRVSPAQKALTVKLVKEGRDAMTLSIGDGANDVAMIQEANIGCGLVGLEGSQAAMSADYAFGQFRFLTKLLIVHGRWSYQRVADMHSNFFYKNVIWTFALFWFLPFNSFDATYLYQYTFILLCNLVFTSLPVIVLGAFDQDINAQAALAFPQLYVRGIRGLEYTRTKFWLYMSDGLYQSAVVFFFPYLFWTLGHPISWTGKGLDSLADFGTTVAVSAILTANTYVGMNTHYWTVITWIVVFGSTIVMMLWIVVYSFFPTSDFNDEVVVLFGSVQFWVTVFFCAAVALAPRFLVKFFTTVYLPLDKNIVREMWVKGDLKDQLGIKHRRQRKAMKKQLEENRLETLEAVPMFTQQHLRSLSEISNSGEQYELARTSSPGQTNLRPTYISTPPMTQASDIDYAQYATQPQASTSGSAQDRHLSPPNTGLRLEMNPSPQPSYYSASDLPPQSPLPSPTYKLPSGEITKTPPSRRTSIATTRSRAGYSQYHTSNNPMPSDQRVPASPTSPHSPHSINVNVVTPTTAGASPRPFELHVRRPSDEFSPTSTRQEHRQSRNPFYQQQQQQQAQQQQQQQQQQEPHSPTYSQHQHQYGYGQGHVQDRTGSSASYRSANDDFWTAEDGTLESPTREAQNHDRHTQQQQQQQQYQRQQDLYQNLQFQQQHPQHGGEDSRSHSRADRASYASSQWDGGYAM